ncbi:LOW QUALITY PROTEIN: hypothetical protein Cgig2_027203 [Carnegiea gigantea]|uniref:Uncharacterized protein n=1 Tax=Carnegiea gigantea TaxID=171969 RepID=A0A9Q1KQW9_9CARY|nr:LOW QUALITY PROTEIN: hypothetical protein Cgig2_027203 [Carnegiea gigantea]
MVSIGMANTPGKILKDQKAGRGEKEIVHKKLQLRLPITRLALPPLRALHGLNCLSHKLRDGRRPVVITYVKLEVVFLSSAVGSPDRFLTGLPSFQSRTSPQPDSRYTKRKSYFQCFTFDFFSIAVMKPGLSLKQYHPKSLVSFGALWTICMRPNARVVQVRPWSSQVAMKEQTLCHDMKIKPDTVVQSHTINGNTFCKRLIHCSIHLGDHEGISGGQKRVGAPGNSGPSATISVTNPLGARPFLLSTDLPRANGPSGDEEVVHAPFEDELLNKRSEE